MSGQVTASRVKATVVNANSSFFALTKRPSPGRLTCWLLCEAASGLQGSAKSWTDPVSHRKTWILG